MLTKGLFGENANREPDAPIPVVQRTKADFAKPSPENP